MTSEEFKAVFDESAVRRWKLLGAKNTQYSRTDNRFQSFDEAAAFEGSHPIHECWHGLKKHLTAIKNLVQDNENAYQGKSDVYAYQLTIENWLEKLDDARNYLDLMEGLVRRTL